MLKAQCFLKMELMIILSIEHGGWVSQIQSYIIDAMP